MFIGYKKTLEDTKWTRMENI